MVTVATAKPTGKGGDVLFEESWRFPASRYCLGDASHHSANYLDAGEWSLPGEGQGFQPGSTRLHVPSAGVRNACVPREDLGLVLRIPPPKSRRPGPPGCVTYNFLNSRLSLHQIPMPGSFPIFVSSRSPIPASGSSQIQVPALPVKALDFPLKSRSPFVPQFVPYTPKSQPSRICETVLNSYPSKAQRVTL